METALPYIVEPAGAPGLDALVAWLDANRADLDRALLVHGAVLLRGFEVRSKADFARLARTALPVLVPYTAGNSPRTALGDNIYTSTEYPAQLDLPLHNELACASRWPAQLMLFCRVAPESGGETPLLDGRRFLRTLPTALRRRFEGARIAYHRTLRSQHRPGPGKPWEVVFETERRDEVEAACVRAGMTFAWTADAALRTRYCREAVLAHPATGELAWFNQIVLFHPSSVPARARRFCPDDPRDGHLYCCFEDGTPIDDALVDAVRAHAARHEVVAPWRAGDVLLVDNVLVAHGRRAFRGPREILLAMADGADA